MATQPQSPASWRHHGHITQPSVDDYLYSLLPPRDEVLAEMEAEATKRSIPIIGPALFDQQSLVYLSWLLFAGVAWFLYKSRAGLVLRAVGESPVSAHSIGYPVIRIRYLATIYTPLWVEGMVAGRGWIALALVVFATWRPVRVLVGAYLFGGVMITQLFLQGSGAQIDIPSQFLSSLPYWATIIVLVVISRNVQTIRLNSPVSLGQPYRPD